MVLRYFREITSFGIQFFEQEVQIDEATLSEIATLTGGKYYRATSNTSLENVYNEINSLEKSKIKTNKIYNYEEYFQGFSLDCLGVFIDRCSFKMENFQDF